MPANLARCRRAWRMAPPRQGVGLFLRNFHVWLIGPRVFLKGRWYHRRENGFHQTTLRTSACILIASFMAVLLSYRRHRRYSPPSAKCEGLRRASERSKHDHRWKRREERRSWIFHVFFFFSFLEDGVELSTGCPLSFWDKEVARKVMILIIFPPRCVRYLFRDFFLLRFRDIIIYYLSSSRWNLIIL